MKRCFARRRQKRDEKFGRLKDELTSADATPAVDASVEKRNSHQLSYKTDRASQSPHQASIITHSPHSSYGNSSSIQSSLPVPSPLKSARSRANLPRLSKNLPSMHMSDESSMIDMNSGSLQWNVKDNKLKPYPPFYPPICRNTSTYVGDSSPSIVASRIAECLKKRGTCVEYDEDAATAIVWTIDKVNFTIHLHRGGKLLYNPNCSPSSSIKDLSTSLDPSLSGWAEDEHHVEVDFNHGVLVECSRLRGDVISFHAECRAVLSSAKGESDGLDDHRGWLVPLHHSPFDFGDKMDRAKLSVGNVNSKQIMRMKDDDVPSLARLRRKHTTSSLTSSILESLENAAILIEKDRWDAKLSGIQNLVILTTVRSVGLERAYLASLCVLGAKDGSIRGQRDSEISRLHEKISSIILKEFRSKRRFGGESNDEMDVLDNEDAVKSEYFIRIRSCALILLINALSNLMKYRALFPLLSKPSCDEYLSQGFIDALADDLAGSSRPPGPTVSCAHESALAARLIYLISTHSEDRTHLLSNAYVGHPPRPLYALLERARSQGILTSRTMELEAQLALSTVAGDV